MHIKLSTSTYELIIFFYTFQTETEKGRKFLYSSTMAELCEVLGKKDQFCKRQVSKAPMLCTLFWLKREKRGNGKRKGKENSSLVLYHCFYPSGIHTKQRKKDPQRQDHPTWKGGVSTKAQIQRARVRRLSNWCKKILRKWCSQRIYRNVLPIRAW